MGLLDALRDPQFRKDLKTNAWQLAQSMSNTAAGTVTAPVDAISWLLNKGGLNIKNPVGGSDWAKLKGLTQDVPEGLPKVAGETLGLLAPLMGTKEGAAATARTLRQLGENAAKPRTMNPETGAIVWHGSPHKFDKFDSSKIGTGEGAQAYGHGLYLAESPDVGAAYQQALGGAKQTYMLGGKEIDRVALNEIDRLGLNIAARPKEYTLRALEDSGLPPQTIQRVASAAKKFAGATYEDVPLGHLYKVDLPDDQIARMLDWDKPLSQQAPEVRAAIQKTRQMLPPNAMDDLGGDLSLLYGGHVGADSFLGTMNSLGPNMGETLLSKAGVPGVRYLESGSRGAGAGQGSSNFVVFPGNEGLLKILERNGQALP